MTIRIRKIKTPRNKGQSIIRLHSAPSPAPKAGARPKK